MTKWQVLIAYCVPKVQWVRYRLEESPFLLKLRTVSPFENVAKFMPTKIWEFPAISKDLTRDIYPALTFYGWLIDSGSRRGGTKFNVTAQRLCHHHVTAQATAGGCLHVQQRLHVLRRQLHGFARRQVGARAARSALDRRSRWHSQRWAVRTVIHTQKIRHRTATSCFCRRERCRIPCHFSHRLSSAMPPGQTNAIWHITLMRDVHKFNDPDE